MLTKFTIIHRTLYNSAQVNIENQDQFEDSLPDVKRFVHFDLAAAPPNIAYLKQIFELIAEMGGNGVFLEYEATFPFDGDLSVLTNRKRSYTETEINGIVKMAHELNLEIVPVIDVCTNAFYITKSFEQLRVKKDCFMDLNPMLTETNNFVHKERVGKLIFFFKITNYEINFGHFRENSNSIF